MLRVPRLAWVLGTPRLRLATSLARTQRRAVALSLSASASVAALASCSSDSVISATQQEDIAATVAEKISIGPFMLMPASLKDAIVLKIVAAVSEAIGSSDIDEATRAEIKRAAESYSEGVSPETVDRVVAAVNKLVNIPLVEEEVEQAIIRQVVSLMLGDAGPLHLLGATVQTSGSLMRALLEPERRAQLAARLSEAVDLPFLSDEQERKLIDSSIHTLGSALVRHAAHSTASRSTHVTPPRNTAAGAAAADGASAEPRWARRTGAGRRKSDGARTAAGGHHPLCAC